MVVLRPRLVPGLLAAAAKANARHAGSQRCMTSTAASAASSPVAASSLRRSTFANQDALPRLPVPDLLETFDKFLRSCEPLMNENQIEDAKTAIKAFVKREGFGEVLQERLINLDRKSQNSWLEDIWLREAYLKYREPNMINVNWWCMLKNHPDHPKELLTKPPPKDVVTVFQIQRTAGLINNLLNFKQQIDSETLPAEYIKDQPLCMNAYKYLFGGCRIPGDTEDSFVSGFPSSATHIIVLTKNQFYKVDVIHADGSRVPLKELERVLYAVGKDSLETKPEPKVGILTAGHRDTFAQAYKLLESSPTNKENLDLIKKSLFVVCLDDFSTSKNLDMSHRQFFHASGHNRWFDKPLQLIVGNNGRAGINGEHSPLDGVIAGKLMNSIVDHEPAVDHSSTSASRLPPPQKLKWDVNNETQKLIETAEKDASKLIKSTDSILLNFKVYGSQYIKDIAQASPDSFVQLALQLTWKRMYEKPTAIYESASTRFFKHGRTETGRSLTTETWQFAKNFDNDDILYETKRAEFKEAIKSHRSYMQEAAAGYGIDRHILGLRAVSETDEERAIFDHTAFKKSTDFRLSTSNMSPGDKYKVGFGPVHPDGYGVCYTIEKDSMNFSISAKNTSKKTDVYKFRETLEQSLKDVMILFPKRSSIWGNNWRERREKESKEEYFFKTMQKLSDKYVAEREKLREKYTRPSDKNSNTDK